MAGGWHCFFLLLPTVCVDGFLSLIFILSRNMKLRSKRRASCYRVGPECHQTRLANIGEMRNVALSVQRAAVTRWHRWLVKQRCCVARHTNESIWYRVQTHIDFHITALHVWSADARLERRCRCRWCSGVGGRDPRLQGNGKQDEGDR